MLKSWVGAKTQRREEIFVLCEENCEMMKRVFFLVNAVITQIKVWLLEATRK